MASNQEYLVYVLDLLRRIPNITYKRMMGEYLLYKDGILFGGIYDNRFLVKITLTSASIGLIEEIPYPTGKMMYLVDNEDPRALEELILGIVADLSKA